jgi:hypothetical protein
VPSPAALAAERTAAALAAERTAAALAKPTDSNGLAIAPSRWATGTQLPPGAAGCDDRRSLAAPIDIGAIDAASRSRAPRRPARRP